MSAHSSTISTLHWLVATAAVVDAQSYRYRWTASDETSSCTIQLVDARQITPVVKAFPLSLSPHDTVASFLEAVALSDGAFVSNLQEDVFTVILSCSREGADPYLPSDLTSFSRSVTVTLDNYGQVQFHALPPPYSVNIWLSERCSVAYSTLSSVPPSHRLSAIPVVSEKEQVAMLLLGEDTEQTSEVTYPCLHHYFEEIALASPSLPALAFDSERKVTTLTYGEMDRRCCALAAHMVAVYGIGPGSMVPIFFTRGIEMMIAILSVVSHLTLCQFLLVY